MANIVKHRFASGKTDGADGTQVQPSHWNDGHAFSGGTAGDVLTRDPTDASFGAKWATPVPIGTWADRTFNAGLFGATGGWVVSAGNVTLNAYSKHGATIFFTMSLNGTTLYGSPTNLVIGLSDITAPATRLLTGLFHYWCSTYSGIGFAEWQTASSDINLFRDIGGTAFAPTSNLFIRMTIIGSIP